MPITAHGNFKMFTFLILLILYYYLFISITYVIIRKYVYFILSIIYLLKINYTQLPISRTRKGPGKVSDLARCPTYLRLRISCK